MGKHFLRTNFQLRALFVLFRIFFFRLIPKATQYKNGYNKNLTKNKRGNLNVDNNLTFGRARTTYNVQVQSKILRDTQIKSSCFYARSCTWGLSTIFSLIIIILTRKKYNRSTLCTTKKKATFTLFYNYIMIELILIEIKKKCFG